MVEVEIRKLRQIYDLLRTHYSTSQLETGDDEETEQVLAELKEILKREDPSFESDNSLYTVASESGLGEPLLTATKNNQSIPLEQLKTVFFPEADTGFHTKDIGWNAYNMGKDRYVVYYGKSFQSAIKRLKELINQNDKIIGIHKDIVGYFELEKEENKTYERVLKILSKTQTAYSADV